MNDQERVGFHLGLLNAHAQQLFSFLLTEICASPVCTVIQYFEGEIVSHETLNHLGVDYYEIHRDGKLIFTHTRLREEGMMELEMSRFFEMIKAYPDCVQLTANESELIHYFLEMEENFVNYKNKNIH